MMIANRGDDLPVSAMPDDGTFPTGTTQYEKRSIAQDIPIWDAKICIQCGLCSLVCPHATIRMKAFDPALLAGARPGSSRPTGGARSIPGWKMTLQVAPDDCTGCGAVRRRLPGQGQGEGQAQGHRHGAQGAAPGAERANWDFFLTLPDVDRTKVKADTVKGSQLLLPLFEFSGACAGCGETPYVKLHYPVLRRPHADRQRHGLLLDLRRQPALHALHGQHGRQGTDLVQLALRGRAEFGFGMRLAVDQQIEYAAELLRRLGGKLGDELVAGLLDNRAGDRRGDRAAAGRVAELNAAAGGDRRARTPRTWLAVGRLPRPQERLELRRRRLGLRHRLRRPGPRPRLRPQREHPGAGHRGLLQHRRPGVEGHAPRRRGQVRRRRQARPQEGPGHDRHVLRQRLRGPDLAGRQPAARHQDHPRGRVVSRHLAPHRLQPLHRLGHRHDHRA